MILQIPKWKKYLYDLQERIILYRKINKGKVLGLNPGDQVIFRNFLKHAGKGEILRKPRAFIIYEFVKEVERNPGRCSTREFKIAAKLSFIKKLFLEDLIMEISELKSFAKEVGLALSIKEIKNMDEVDLIREIVQKVNPKENYSNEFVEWYSDLDENGPYFKSPKKESEKTSKKKETEEPEIDVKEIKTAIQDADDIDELQEIINEYNNIFDEELLEEDDVEELQAKMLKILKGGKAKASKKEEKQEDVDIDMDGVIKAVQDAEDLDTLKEIKNDDDVKHLFEEVSTRGKIKFETLQANMLEALGVSKEDDDNVLEELEAMSISELRNKAKKMGINVKFGTPKEEMIEVIVNEINKGKEVKTEEENVEVDQSLIKKLVKEKDLESLLQIAKEMEIKIGILEKKSPIKVGDKIIAKLEELEEDKPSKKEEKKTGTRKILKKDKEQDETKGSLFAAIKEMLVDQEKDENYVLKKVKQMIKIVQSEE